MTLLDHVDPAFRPIPEGWNMSAAPEVWQVIDHQLNLMLRRIAQSNLWRPNNDNPRVADSR